MQTAQTGQDGSRFLKRVLAEVQGRVREDQYRAWFHDLSLLKLDDQCAEFGVRSVFIRDWLNRNYLPVMEQSVAGAEAAGVEAAGSAGGLEAGSSAGSSSSLAEIGTARRVVVSLSQTQEDGQVVSPGPVPGSGPGSFAGLRADAGKPSDAGVENVFADAQTVATPTVATPTVAPGMQRAAVPGGQTLEAVSRGRDGARRDAADSSPSSPPLPAFLRKSMELREADVQAGLQVETQVDAGAAAEQVAQVKPVAQVKQVAQSKQVGVVRDDDPKSPAAIVAGADRSFGNFDFEGKTGSCPQDVVLEDEEVSLETIVEGSGLSSKYTFEHFVQGPCNQLAHAAAIAVGENPGCAFNPLYVHGSVGLGKTHLLQATCHAILRRRRVARVSYQSCEDFTNRYIRAVQDKALDEFRAVHRSVDVLVIDDVQFLANKERTQEEFFHTFNALRNEGCQIVISSDCPPSDIAQLQERLVSRFKWGLVVEMEAPTFETRVSIARRKASVLGHELSDEVASMIAERVDKNIRELEGAVIKVISMAQLMNHPLDTELTNNALRDLPTPRSAPVSWNDIMELITDEYSVTKKDLLGKGRTQTISLPRQIGMYLTRELTEMSLEEVGRKFGNRDHTTVLYAVQKLTKRLREERKFRETIDALRSRLQG